MSLRITLPTQKKVDSSPLNPEELKNQKRTEGHLKKSSHSIKESTKFYFSVCYHVQFVHFSCGPVSNLDLNLKFLCHGSLNLVGEEIQKSKHKDFSVKYVTQSVKNRCLSQTELLLNTNFHWVLSVPNKFLFLQSKT